MKLVVTRTSFLKTLSQVYDGVPPKATEPTYLNFFIGLSAEEQIVQATDSNITIKCNIASEKEEDAIKSFEEGMILAPAKYLLDIIRQLEGDVVTLSQIENGVLNITDGFSNFNINCIPQTENPFTDFPYEVKNEIAVSGAEYSALYNTTAFAVAVKGPKKQFYGVKVAVHSGILEFIATDSYRLARKKVEVESQADFSFIVPVKALSLVNKYSEMKEIRIKVDNNWVYFEIEGLMIASKLYSGDFPNVESITPTVSPYILTVDSKCFSNALSRVTIVSPEKLQVVHLRCFDGVVTVFARSENIGTGREEIKNATFEGEDLEIGFNYNFVNDAIKALASQTITFKFTSEARAFLIENGDPSITQLITPIRPGSGN